MLKISQECPLATPRTMLGLFLIFCLVHSLPARDCHRYTALGVPRCSEIDLSQIPDPPTNTKRPSHRAGGFDSVSLVHAGF
jgi:hypothetical protein